MSIDTKEWGGKLNEMGMLPEVVSFSRFTQWVIDLIRAVIADEAAKPVSFVGKGATNYVGMPSYEELLAMTRSQKPAERPDEPAKSADEVFAKAQPDEPRAEGDVPEWFGTAVRSIVLATDTMVRDAWSIASPHITRRVAEATAGRDRRIAELEAECERLNILIQATAEAWLSLEPGVAWEGAIDAAMKAAVNEIKKLRQQLADATRPVEGVEELVELTCKESFVSFDAVSWLSVKSLMANAAKKAIQRERAARLADDKRAASAEGLMRGFSQLAFTLCRRWHYDEGHSAKNVNECREGWCGEFAKLNTETKSVDVEAAGLLHDRAIAAEAERDELREAWKRMRVLMNCGSKDKFYRVRIDEECLTDDDIESLLVAFREFRAEKGKVQACPTGG